MAQISLYVDDETLAKITERAKKEQVSISKWVNSIINKDLKPNYSPEYIALIGSLADTDLEAPDEIPSSFDIPRESL